MKSLFIFFFLLVTFSLAGQEASWGHTRLRYYHGEGDYSEDIVQEENFPERPFESLEEITRIHAQMLRKDYRLFWTASRGIGNDLTDHIFLSYEHYSARTIMEARILLVRIVQSYLAAIKWSPQLGHYPFTTHDLEVEIHFDNFHGQYVDRQYVQWVKMKHNLICYQAYNCWESKFCFIRRERFDQAVHFAELDLAEQASEKKEDDYYRELQLEAPPAKAVVPK